MIKSSSTTDPVIEAAIARVETFTQKFGTEHLYFASHAAFPLAIDPTLAYCLWGKFRSDISQRPLNIPWLAVADLLLSDLCQEVEAELYEMDVSVRAVLLNELKLEPKFGETRLRELSEFLLNYVEKQLQRKTPQLIDTDVAQVHRWIALGYVDPKQAASELVLELRQQDWGNKLELVRMASLLETFVEPLKDFQPLLVYGRGMGKYGRGDKKGAEADFARLERFIEVEDLRLEIPRFFKFEVITVNSQGEIINREHKEARYFTEDLGNGVTLDMVAIPGGKFMMGSPEGEGEKSEIPQHEVTVQPFFMGKFQVTQKQWKVIASREDLKVKRDLKHNPSYFKGDNRPVEQVSWDDAVEFCQRLSKQTGKEYRLPSEAEWEYACRAGTTTPYYFGDTITNNPHSAAPRMKYQRNMKTRISIEKSS